MATLEVPVWMQNDTYAAAQDRTLVDNLWGADGVIGVGDLAVTQRAAGTNMSVDVASGVGVVTGDDAAAQGKYLIRHLSGPSNVALTTSPGTGNSRIDLIVARIRDAAVIGGGNNDFIFDKVTGTAAATGSQVAPALPASCMLLAQVAVGPNVTTILNANITDQRRRAYAMSGGIAICTAGPPTRPVAPWPGQMIYEVDTQKLRTWNGTAWTTTAASGYVHLKAFRSTSWNTAIGGGAYVFNSQLGAWDETGSYSTGTTFFVPPVSGYFKFSVRIGATSTAAGQFIQCFLRHNNVQVYEGSTGISTATAQIIDTVLPGVTEPINAGDNAQIFYNASWVGAGDFGIDKTYLVVDQVG